MAVDCYDVRGFSPRELQTYVVVGIRRRLARIRKGTQDETQKHGNVDGEERGCIPLGKGRRPEANIAATRNPAKCVKVHITFERLEFADTTTKPKKRNAKARIQVLFAA